MTSLWLVLSALECADQYAEAFGAGYARGLWHGAGAVLLIVIVVAGSMRLARKRD